jgi:uncharacterized protein YcfL
LFFLAPNGEGTSLKPSYNALMRVLPFVFASILFSLLLAGCSSKPTLVGDWEGTLTVGAATVAMGVNFGNDGKLDIKQSVGAQGSTQKGTYVAEEKEIKATITALESASLPKGMIDAANSNLAKTPQKMTFTLKWKDADTINITQQGAPAPLNVPITLKRKK